MNTKFFFYNQICGYFQNALDSSAQSANKVVFFVFPFVHLSQHRSIAHTSTPKQENGSIEALVSSSSIEWGTSTPESSIVDLSTTAP